MPAQYTPSTRSMHNSGEEWRGYPRQTQRRRAPAPFGPGLMVAGLAVVGLGALTWYYLGPELVRYWKMHNM